MPRLSCSFCVLSSRSALVRAAQLRADLGAEYLRIEQVTGHSFRKDRSMAEIVGAAGAGEAIGAVEGWVASGGANIGPGRGGAQGTLAGVHRPLQLRPEQPPDDTAMVVRGGVLSREDVERTALMSADHPLRPRGRARPRSSRAVPICGRLPLQCRGACC
jgi:hypothetical protein